MSNNLKYTSIDNFVTNQLIGGINKEQKLYLLEKVTSIEHYLSKFRKQTKDNKVVNLKYQNNNVTVKSWFSKIEDFLRSMSDLFLSSNLMNFILFMNLEGISRCGDEYDLLTMVSFCIEDKKLEFYILLKIRKLLSEMFGYFDIDLVINDIIDTPIGEEIFKTFKKKLKLNNELKIEMMPLLIDHKFIIINEYIRRAEQKGLNSIVINSSNKRRKIEGFNFSNSQMTNNNTGDRNLGSLRPNVLIDVTSFMDRNNHNNINSNNSNNNQFTFEYESDYSPYNLEDSSDYDDYEHDANNNNNNNNNNSIMEQGEKEKGK